MDKQPTRKKQAPKANPKNDKQKLLHSMQLKSISTEDASVLHTVFFVLDMDEDGFLSTEEAYTWFRASGWAWSDEQLETALKRGGDKEQWGVVELMRIADSHKLERFELERDQAKIQDTFSVLDFDKHGSLMRADLHKFLSSYCNPQECNRMLDTLGYQSNALTFSVDELVSRTAAQLNEPRTREFVESLSTVH
jgi:Ca2+-binding EF-hand superfamily protein